MMEHWRKVLPAPLLEVDYEETVANLEGVARRLVGWCGLAWEPACLEFHGETAGQNGQCRAGPPAGLQHIGGKMEALRTGPGPAVRPAENGDELRSTDRNTPHRVRSLSFRQTNYSPAVVVGPFMRLVKCETRDLSHSLEVCFQKTYTCGVVFLQTDW